MDKILFTGRRQKQCRDAQHQTGDSRRFKTDLPLVHRNNTGYITANRLVSSSKTGKSCTETTALSRQNLLCPGPLFRTERCLELPCSSEAAKESRQGFPFSLSSIICLQESGAEEPTHCAALLLPMRLSLSRHGLPWDLAGSLLSCTSPQNWKSPMSSLAELSGKINTSNKYIYPQTT